MPGIMLNNKIHKNKILDFLEKSGIWNFNC